MLSPLTWEGDGPPQALPVSSSPHCAAQLDASHSLASLTFIASQLSTLLYSVALASSAASSPSSSPHSITSAVPLPHSPSPIAPPLSNSLALCHSNLTAALANVLSTSFQLIVQSTPITSPTSHITPRSTSLPLSTSSSTSSPLPTPVSIPPHFTIRVVTDLEPVTPTRSRSPSPSPLLACSPTLSLATAPTVTVPSDTPTAEQSAIVEKATLHLVSAAATASASQAPPTDCSDSKQHLTSTPHVSPLATSTQPITPTISAPSSSSPVHPVARTVDATDGADESDVAAKATSHLVSAATTSPPVDSAQPVNSDEDDQHSSRISTFRPSTRSTDTPIHPFFVDLSNRTGKAAKHFRRMYVPTSTICECGLFPAFSARRQPCAPTLTLPEPFQRLCLSCLCSLASEWDSTCGEFSCGGIYYSSVLPLFWDDAWMATVDSHYRHYYTQKQLAALKEKGSCSTGAETQLDRADKWIQQSIGDAVKAERSRMEGSEQ